MAFLFLLGAIVVLSGSLYLIFRLTIGGFGAMVDKRQRETEFVLFTGRVPPGWMPRRPLSASGPPRRQRRARRRARRKLRKLMRYYKHTPFVASESERSTQLARMKDVAADWKETDWQEIILP